MYLCFLDESKFPEPDARFILAAVCIPANRWTAYERRISAIKSEFKVDRAEIHSCWLAQTYPEQHEDEIPGFENLDSEIRRRECLTVQNRILKLKRSESFESARAIKDLKHRQKNREPYLHLTLKERTNLVQAVAGELIKWNDAFIILSVTEARALGKQNLYVPALVSVLMGIGAEVKSGLAGVSKTCVTIEGDPTVNCIVVHDAAEKPQEEAAAFFTEAVGQVAGFPHFGPTPLFVDSRTTNMLQLADVCAFAVRNIFAKKDESLLRSILPKTRSYTGRSHIFKPDGCECLLCKFED